MDLSFIQMQNLFHAVWGDVSKIDWALYCGSNVAPYDDDSIPKYTGLLMHRSGGGCVGANTVVANFLPRPEKSARIVADKTGLIDADPRIKASMERRNPKKNHWGGGIRSSVNTKEAYAITGLPEIGDHMLIAQMMKRCEILSADDWVEVMRVDSPYMTDARAFVDMSESQFGELRGVVRTIVRDGMSQLLS